MTFAQIDDNNLVVGIHQTDVPFDDTEHFIEVPDDDSSIMGKVYDKDSGEFKENPNVPEPVEQKAPVTLDTIHSDNLTTMESNAALYEELTAVKENQLTMMESIADLYEQEGDTNG